MQFNRRPKWPSQKHNWETIRSAPLMELSGALGDLGTLLPILIALAVTGSISISSSLVFAGIANICTGMFFGIPLPVQPMKAIAAVAIARNFTRDETASAGLLVAGVIGFCSITGLLNWLGRVCPIPVVKGIQVGAGLQLIITAGESLLRPLGWRGTGWEDNWWWALLAFVVLLISTAPSNNPGLHNRKGYILPYALIMFVLGLIISIICLNKYHHDEDDSDHFHPGYHRIFHIWHPHTSVPSAESFRIGAIDAGLGQIPLTALNSIIAVTHLSAELLPNQPVPSPFSIGSSIAIFNLVGCFFHAMPICHGSGGLAAQYRFGARSGASVIVLGIVKLVLGLIFDGTALMAVLRRFPKSLLGIMVIAAGIELTRVGESLNSSAKDLWTPDGDGDSRAPELPERTARWVVMMITVAGLLAFKNDAVGFIAGILAHMSLSFPDWWSSRHERGGLFKRLRNGRGGAGGADERTGLLGN